MFGLEENKEQVIKSLVCDLQKLTEEDLILLRNSADTLKIRETIREMKENEE